MYAESTYISEKTRDSNNNVINPATLESINSLIDAVETISLTESPLRQGDEGELLTRDMGIDRVLGSSPLTDEGNLKTKMISGDIQGIVQKVT